MSIPKNIWENIEYRIELNKRLDNKYAQKAVMAKCREGADGFLFWLNSFVWLFEPRPIRIDGKAMPAELPFCSWPHQDEAARQIFESLGYEDIGIEKSRGEGASWLVLMVFLHQWIFEPLRSFGLVSRNEDAVDKPGDPSSLMWKLDWELTKLPEWMVPSYTRQSRDHVLKNEDNKSTIVGYTATADLASGGRTTAFLMDEMAKFPTYAAEQAMSSTEPVTECRIIVSTPKGATGAYYKAMRENSSIRKIRLHWHDNPIRNRGMYRVVGMEPCAVDPENPLPPGYAQEWKQRYRDQLIERGYSIMRGLRSPWYDQRCLRTRMTPMTVAQEYDIDYVGSTAKFFSGLLLDRLEKETVREEILRGEITFNDEDFEPRFVPSPEGRLRLWIPLTGLKGNQPPGDCQYVVGCDISSGQGGASSSNSIASVVNRQTGVKVAEFATNIMSPEAFADLSIALCKWFTSGEYGHAYLIWEDNGCGGNFRNQILRQGYRNFYLRRVEDSISKKKTEKPGWRSSKDSKASLLMEYQYALQNGLFTNPCREAIAECRKYQQTPDGNVEFEGLSSDDEDVAKNSHGDRVIADAVAWHAVSEFSVRKAVKKKVEVPPTSFAARQLAMARGKKNRLQW
ncbi:MAG: hypothetical protein E6Q97_17460 [Desulfurellales bacterium]|nr:MAG: hypothetical protein E6Q97_17460 [Desulfurellales bacterium]